MAQLFYKLNLPGSGKDRHGTIKWHVRVERIDLMYYLLSDVDHEVADLNKTPEVRFCFDSEFDAHEHACEYYTSHGKPYPYFSEFMYAGKRTGMPTPVPKIVVYAGQRAPTLYDPDGGSQVMIFK